MLPVQWDGIKQISLGESWPRLGLTSVLTPQGAIARAAAAAPIRSISAKEN